MVAAVLAWRLVAIWRQPPPSPPATLHLQFVPPPLATLRAGEDTLDAALSPGDDEVVFVATLDGQPALWRRRGSERRAERLPGTDSASAVAWIHGQRAVSFFAGRDLKAVTLDTGTVTTVASAIADPAGAAWLDDGSVLVGRQRGPIERWQGGSSAGVTTLQAGDTGHRFPARVGPDAWVYLAERADGSRQVRLSRSGMDRDLTRADGHAIHVAGWLLYPRGGALLAQRLDQEAGRLTGRADAIVADVGVSSAGRTQAAVSARLLLAGPAAGAHHRLVWHDAAGQAQRAVSEPGDYWQVRLSPDDTQAAVTMLEPLLRTLDVYVLRGGSGSPLPVSLGLAAESDPVWSPDGLSLLFRSSRASQGSLFTRRVAVQGAPESRVEGSPGGAVPSDWTAAGQMIFSAPAGDRPDTDIFRLAAGGATDAVFAGGFNQTDARVSADGRLVAYVSDESGEPEVYVTSWPPRPAAPGSAPARTRVSHAGGSRPRWTGRSLYFRRGEGEILRADPLPGPNGGFTVPVPVMTLPGLRDFDAAHRSARILAVVPAAAAPPAAAEALVDWMSSLGASSANARAAAVP